MCRDVPWCVSTFFIFVANHHPMKRLFIILTLAFIAINLSAQVQPTWESINQRGYPQWFSDAKLGIFIHWGLYSVPAYASPDGYAEWYYRGLMMSDNRKEFMERVYGKDFRYEDFVPMWKAELWNPDEWAELFKKSGAKYVLLVSKHHDGYCLWPSQYAPGWNSVETGPHRDICGELTEAVRKQGLQMGFYYSLPEWTSKIHCWYEDPDDSIAEYVDTHMIPQFKELVSAYKPTVLFTDGEWRNSAEQWHATELISWYYNTVGDEAIVNDRWGNGQQHGFRTPEYTGRAKLNDRPWAECRGIGRSFGLNRNEPLENYLTSDELIRHFVILVAAGGGMTINVGPAADGTIPMLQQERLLDLGKWLEINGEAIYGSQPYRNDTVAQPKVCYTRGNDALYAIALEYPDEQLVLDIDKPSKKMTVTLLGCDEALPWRYEKGHLVIETGSLRYGDIRSTAAWVFKLSQSGF